MGDDLMALPPRIAEADEGVASQTLSRGLWALRYLCAQHGPVRVDEVAAALEVHRSIAWRLLRTLEHHHLVRRTPSGSYAPGSGLAVLARQGSQGLLASSQPVLDELAESSGLTAFVAVANAGSCVTVASATAPSQGASIVQQPGTSHPLTQGAPGLVLLAMQPPGAAGEREADVQKVRERGYATSSDEVIPGVRSVAVPIPLPDRRAALAVLGLGDLDLVDVVGQLRRAAGRITES
ncbi:IclR family transcriptional regulator [Luteococcus peritonei]|uniref:IclR family transcriptional regulator n=1 Tax=Luteococcus peritonei TaxID=88874 RepID=A0ABW4RUR2_9ACTN